MPGPGWNIEHPTSLNPAAACHAGTDPHTAAHHILDTLTTGDDDRRFDIH
jgi:hypothetical protein